MSNSIIEVGVTDEKLVISIGITTLAFAASLSEIFSKYENPTILDNTEFAQSIARALKIQDFRGTTPVTRILDEAIEYVTMNRLNSVVDADIEPKQAQYN